MLTGYKTYTIAAVIAVLAAAKYLGYVDEGTFQALMAILLAGGLGTVHSAIVANGSANAVTPPTPSVP